MKKNEASKYFPTQKLIDKIFDDLEKQKCSNCKFKKEVFSYNLPLCTIEESEPFQITNENRTQCTDWENT